MDRETRIRERAHQLWEDEGRPDGLDQQHWDKATLQVDDEDRQGRPVLTEAAKLADEFTPEPDGGGSGLASSLQPGGTVPGDVKNASVGSIGTGGGSTRGRATGTAKRPRG